MPAAVLEQERAAALVADALADPAAARLAGRIFARAGIDRRYVASALGDRAREALGALGGIGARMRAWEGWNAALGVEAARAALEDAGVEPAEITHLVWVTCTGARAPGPDVAAAVALGLPADVERTCVGFMGCSGAFNGLRAGAAAVRGAPGARALVVASEVCSLHATASPRPDRIVAHAIFGDGAAAAVLAADGRRPRARLGHTTQRLLPELGDLMVWELGPLAFEVSLARSIPSEVAKALPRFLAEAGFRADHGETHFCVHPGGIAILEAVEHALGLGPRALASAREVLRAFGNLSSATILLVLGRELGRMLPGAPGLLLGFGPGFTIEAWAFEAGPRRDPVPAPRRVAPDA